MSTSPDLAKRYWVDDVPSAATAGTRLNNILGTLATGQPLTAANKDFLTERGLLILVGVANGEVTEDQFSQLARTERERRIAERLEQQQLIEARRRADQTAADAREAAMWARLKTERIERESDPKFIARQKNRELRRKYDVDVFVEDHYFARLMKILRMIDNGSRLSAEDAVWLRSEGSEYASEEILRAYNRIEANFHIAEYKRTGDVWKAVSASGHLRKCGSSNEAHELLVAIPDDCLGQAKLKSAVRTTHGGATRDLGRCSDALKLGEEAHALQPNNFRPCTLLGALHIEQGHIGLGHEWYCKAEERGATTDSIVAELRSLLARMAPEERHDRITALVRIDPGRYGGLQRGAAGKARRPV